MLTISHLLDTYDLRYNNMEDSFYWFTIFLNKKILKIMLDGFILLLMHEVFEKYLKNSKNHP